jgi:stearoyl-CoA desaturase (delta-9 desaturase)
MHGLVSLSIWQIALVTFILTHITIISVTIYLHRCQAHRSVTLHPIISHFFRFWLWLTTGIITKSWTAIHRKHHAKCETKEDPHSPQVLGLSTVLWRGAELYKAEAKNIQTLNRYGQGTPNDWLERHIYTPHSNKGYLIMLAIDLTLFGVSGLTMWALQMMSIPFLAAGVVNGVGHYYGYRNFDCLDASTNLFPIGIFIGGEELHNNHHTYPTSAQFSVKKWEFDIGWQYIKLLAMLKLAKVKRQIPKIVLDKNKHRIDIDTLKAIFNNRYSLLRTFQKKVERPFKHFSQNCLEYQQIRNMKRQLQQLWTISSKTNSELLEYLHDWCQRAEALKIKQLADFVAYLRSYTLV